MNIDISEFRFRHLKGPGQARPRGAEATDWRFRIQVGRHEESFRAPGAEAYGRALAGLRAYLQRNYPGQRPSVYLVE